MTCKKWKPYRGTMNTRAMRKLDGRAYAIWNSQKQRCSNIKTNAFKNYGAKGISVEYSVHDFMGWWLWQYKIKGHKFKRAGVGRIDHSKNYSFDNIEMVEHSANAREMYERTGGNKTVEKKPIVLVDEEKGVTHVFSSVKKAAEFAGVTSSLLCLRKRMPAQTANRFTKINFKVYDVNVFLESGV